MVEGKRKPAILKWYRHGRTMLSDTLKVCGGMVDVPLCEIGEQQAEALSVRTINDTITEVHSSPLERGYRTVLPMARIRGLTIKRSPALGERKFGRAIELLADEDQIETIRQDLLLPYWHLPPDERLDARLAPDMETDREVLDRELPYIFGIPPGEIVAAGTHWEVISILALHTTGKLISPDFTTGIEFSVVNKEISIIDFQGNEPLLVHPL